MRQITISGNLGKDPEVRQTQGGMDVANFSVAVRASRPDESGNYNSDWFRCSVWGKRAGTVRNYFHKGDRVTITGTLDFSEYNGRTQYDINVSDFDLPDNHGGQAQSNASSNGNTNNSDAIEISDDDLPF